MSNITRAKIGIFLSTVVLILAVTAMFFTNGSFSWFAGNKNVTPQGFQVFALPPESGMGFTLDSYPVDDITGNNYTFITNVNSIQLPVDDPADVGYSVYKKALVLKLHADENNTAEKTFKVTVHQTSGTVFNDFPVQNCFSNVMKITPARIIADPDASDAREIVEIGETSYTFINGATKSESMVITATDITLQPGENCYFIVEYNKNYLNDLSQYYLSSEEQVQLIVYTNDIYFTLS